MTYAAATSVSVSTSRDDIERCLQRYGADQFAYATNASAAMVAFVAHQRQIRFVLPLPQPDEPRFTRTPTGRARTRSEATKAHAQAVRSAWRSLNLIIKAKLEAVESGVVTFETEFGPFTVLPDGTTMGEHMTRAIESAYNTGHVPPLLEAPMS